jgi:double-stranded uracil-DNA glycosylase
MTKRAHVLPDYLKPGLRVVVCGTVPSRESAQVHHYYAGRGNAFWPLLYEAQLTTEPLTYQEDSRITQFGIGLTDLAKYVASSTDKRIRQHFDARALTRSMARLRPAWIAFNGKTAATFVARRLGWPDGLFLGPQPWSIDDIPVFALPSSSAANRDPSHLEGLSSRLEWYRELANVVGVCGAAADAGA